MELNPYFSSSASAFARTRNSKRLMKNINFFPGTSTGAVNTTHRHCKGINRLKDGESVLLILFNLISAACPVQSTVFIWFNITNPNKTRMATEDRDHFLCLHYSAKEVQC